MPSAGKAVPAAGSEADGDLGAEFTYEELQEQIRQEWSDALGLAGIVPDDPERFKSAEQLMVVFHIGRSAVDNRIRAGMKAGKITKYRVIRAGSDGREGPMNVYEVLKVNHDASH